MLHIKNSSSISLRCREPFFDRSFFVAFGIASLLHLMALLLFRVHSIPIDNGTARVSSMIDIDLGAPSLPKASVSFLDTKQEFLNSLIAAPKPVFPTAIPWVVNLAGQEWEYCLDRLPTDPSFEQLERLPYSLSPFPFGFQRRYPSISVHVAGAAAGLTCEKQEEVWRIYSLPQITEPSLFSYHIRIDNSSGRIFWFERLHSSSAMSELEKVAEEILHQMRFIPQRQMGAPLVTSGVVEIGFGAVL